MSGYQTIRKWGAALCLVWIAASAPAQCAEKMRKMWVLPLGEAPPFRQEVRDGVRQELPPPPGSIPPRSVEVSTGEGEGEPADEGKPALASLMLGRLSQAIRLPAGAKQLTLRDGGTSWLRSPVPEDGDFVMLVWREGKTWSKPASKILTGIGEPGQVIMVNVSPASLGLDWQGKQYKLAPGRVFRSRSAGEPSNLGVYLVDEARGSRRLVQRSIEQIEREWSLVLFFRADGASPRQPVRTIVLRMES